MTKCLLPLVAMILYFLSFANASERSLDVERSILNSIFEGYDKRIRPDGQNATGPVIVDVNIYVRSITNLDDVNMAYDTQLTFRQSWYDDRLKYNNTNVKYVTLTEPQMIWTPDIFFSNELSGQFHNIVVPNILARIYPDGSILYSIRISMRLSCPMHLAKYPFDCQTCSIVAASYGYTTDDVVLSWKHAATFNQDAVQVTRNLYLSKFTLTAFEKGDCTSRTMSGIYSCIKVSFSLKRKFYYYMIQVYIPTAVMVLLSWLIFWLNPKYTNIRFGIILGIFIAFIVLTTSMNNYIPQASYTKAIDVWIGACSCFLFCCIVELLLVVNTLSTDEYSCLKNQFTSDEILEDKNSTGIDGAGKTNQNRKFKLLLLKWLNKRSTAQRIDIFSRLFFPLMFEIFVFAYWMKYSAE